MVKDNWAHLRPVFALRRQEKGMKDQAGNGSGYHRYHIETKKTPDVTAWPSRFKVRVKKSGLAKLLFKEVFHYGIKNKDVILSRPCMYGVFSGPVGGFAPREELCVGCLRCTTEFPDFVRVLPNPERQKLGDTYFTSNYVDVISYEAQTGLIPVKGAGYRGKFGGEGWDGMWTDMSEIVRPTRDGIHGREFISTVVDIGAKLPFLTFNEEGQLKGVLPQTFALPLPFFFDAPPRSDSTGKVIQITGRTAGRTGSLAIVPVGEVVRHKLEGEHIVPLVRADETEWLEQLGFEPRLIEMDGWDEDLYKQIVATFPKSLVALRTRFDSGDELLAFVERGVHIFHLTGDYHGRGKGNAFVLDLIRAAHKTFVDAGIRDEVTLLGSGGMIAAEHVPKAILCGLDAVGLDTAVMAALQAEFNGECLDGETSNFTLPKNLEIEWGVQRLQNLAASWRDQLLEILGAMGLREVRRLRGEMGRAMFMLDLEREAFAAVEGYHA
jgi:hypothetical protein